METKEFKVLRWKDGETSPDDLTGHIIVFDEPLIVHQTIEKTEDEKDRVRVWSEFTGEEAECKFMRADGGFGSYKRCSGRMIIGDFFKSIEDVIANKPFEKGNTKCFPTGFILELFTKHSKL